MCGLKVTFSSELDPPLLSRLILANTWESKERWPRQVASDEIMSSLVNIVQAR